MNNFDELKKRAKDLLERTTVGSVFGYTSGTTPNRRRAVIVRSAKDIDGLTLDEYCEENLTNFMLRNNLPKTGEKSAIFANPQAVRSLNILASEGQIELERIVVLEFEVPVKDGLEEELGKLMKLSPRERFKFWKEHFSRCIKCYACRQSCPMCYCSRCIVECNEPQWICPSAHSLGNFEWNMVRAFHLAGRCSGCGNCERACPVGIPLMLLNEYLAAQVKERFDYVPGDNVEQEPVLASFKKDDPEEFIL